VDFPIKNGDFPLPCWFTRGYKCLTNVRTKNDENLQSPGNKLGPTWVTVSKSGTQESGGPEKAVSLVTTVILFINSCGQTQLVPFNRLGIGQGMIISIWIGRRKCLIN